MADQPTRDRFIPFRKTDIVEMCVNEAKLSKQDQTSFREFCRVLESMIHFEFHRQMEALKDCYAPFNPNADTRAITIPSAEEKKTLQKKLLLLTEKICAVS